MAYQLKTKKNRKSVSGFLAGIENERRREDAREVAALMEEVTGCPPEMWGKDLVGFGSYRYRYASGHEGEWFVTGFSPRKANLVLYIMSGFSRQRELLKKLGKYRTGKACLYVTRLDDIDRKVLRRLVRASVAEVRRREKSGAGCGEQT